MLNFIFIALGFLALIIISMGIGFRYGYNQDRVQCLNCGGHKTSLVSWVSSEGGGNYKSAVKTWEYHRCQDCDAKMTTDIKLVKD